MCVTNGKVKLELYVTPEELILIGKLLKGDIGKVLIKTLDDGEDRPKQKPPNE